MNKKKGILLTLIGLVGLIVITVGVTYAFFNYVKEGTTDNTITTSTITFLYTEIDKVGAGISIKDAYPISDSQGKMLSGTNEVFDFKITSTTPNTSSIPYEITARKNSDSTLDESAVKLYLTKVVGTTEEEVLLSKYSDLTQTSKVTSDKYTEKTIYKGSVPSDSSNYEQAFKLRMWIASDVDFSPLEDGSYPYNDKEFTININVYANAKVVNAEEEALLKNTNINSLSVNDTELTIVEGQNYDYAATLPAGTTSTTIDIETSNSNATVEIEKIDSLAYSSNIKKLSIKKTFDVITGDNYFKVTVTSEDESTKKEYKIKITVLKDADNTLKSLSLTDCPLNEEFDKETTNYTCTMTNNIDTITVSADANSDKAKVTVLGETGLITGENTVTVKVTSESGVAKEYIITVTKPEFKETFTIFNKTFDVVTDKPTLTRTSYDAGDEIGLYKSTDTNSGNPTYYFRGNEENNYVKFAGKIWRIIRINEDGTIRLITDGIMFESIFNSDYSNRDSLYYTNSELKTTLDSWYTTNITKKGYDGKVATGKYFCQQAKAAYNSTYATSSGITMPVFSKYTPDFKCSDDEHGIVDTNIGLISLDEYWYAGGYPGHASADTYLYGGGLGLWTMSPAGVNPAYYNSATMWLINTSSDLDVGYVDISWYVRPVINLRADVTATGNGTSGQPWVIS